jgi:hypothetical protein
LLNEPVIVEEKVDGSQFSFGKFFDNGPFAEKLRCRSKGSEINLVAPPGMFSKAVETIKELEPLLIEGWTYRGEYLAKPKHNTLAYNRVPKRNIILFDINTGLETYLPYEEKKAEAQRLGLEIVPLVFQGMLEDMRQFRSFLERESVLGGPPIEGVVIKNYRRFGLDKKVLMGKFVSEAFKEVHGGEWKAANPTSGDIIQELVNDYKTPARWQKAVQHLREKNELEQSPKDIGKLILEAKSDIEKECADEIAKRLIAYALPKILRGAVAGLPEWYKEELVKHQFNASV